MPVKMTKSFMKGNHNIFKLFCMRLVLASFNLCGIAVFSMRVELLVGMSEALRFSVGESPPWVTVRFLSSPGSSIQEINLNPESSQNDVDSRPTLS